MNSYHFESYLCVFGRFVGLNCIKDMCKTAHINVTMFICGLSDRVAIYPIALKD